MELVVYILLVLTSVVGLTFIIERGLALRWAKVLPPAIEAAVRSCGNTEEVGLLRKVCERHPSPLARILVLASDHLDWPKAETVDALQTQARREIVKLERGLVVLEVIVGIAPLLGLVGTIAGMMSLFGGLGETGLSDTAALAKGIGLILNATLMGLLIAIPCLISWSYYTKKVETMTVEMETLCDEFLRRQYRNRSSDT
ncbi:MAG: MotA/TolQ/ExbB proton channel family protein [Verrucomicrobia bacterium]|jgi:biopolymer transport protein ExbB|nr:MotA/TolQ/ExbB proton channel family protein [Verrucomicrobiota bacterium]